MFSWKIFRVFYCKICWWKTYFDLGTRVMVSGAVNGGDSTWLSAVLSNAVGFLLKICFLIQEMLVSLEWRLNFDLLFWNHVWNYKMSQVLLLLLENKWFYQFIGSFFIRPFTKYLTKVSIGLRQMSTDQSSIS